MSVFNDFQRLWMERFPQSTLSDAWEQDVRASLERHKLKINELKKELEQESLYVEYLERLLSDVEQYRECGGNPTTIFEAQSTGNGTANTATQSSCNNTPESNTHYTIYSDKSSDNLGPTSTTNNTDNKYYINRSSSGNGGNDGSGGNTNSFVKHAGEDKKVSTNITTTTAIKEESKDNGQGDRLIKKINNRDSDNGSVVHQCITELAASISGGSGEHAITTRSSSISSTSSSNGGGSGSLKKIGDNNTKSSHFVTVIEVKENKTPSNRKKDKCRDDLMEHSNERQMPIEIIAAPTAAVGTGGGSGSGGGGGGFSSFDKKTAAATVTTPATAPPLSPSLSSSAVPTSSMSVATHLNLLEAKKKMPPRPPPKNIRRVEPPTIPNTVTTATTTTILSTSSPKMEQLSGGVSSSSSSIESPKHSLERNVKPSDILRHKTSETLDNGKAALNRKTASELNRFINNADFLEELGQKIHKSERLERTKRYCDNEIINSPTNSLGRTSGNQCRIGTTTTTTVTTTSATATAIGISPTSSLNKNYNNKLTTIDNTSTDSLDKKYHIHHQYSHPQLHHQYSLHQTTLQSHLEGGEGAGSVGGGATCNIGSRESLASQGTAAIIKSYESMSSLNSDSAKVSQQQHQQGTVDGSTTHIISTNNNNNDNTNDHVYDSVPLDNDNDDEYVYIKSSHEPSSSISIKCKSKIGAGDSRSSNTSDFQQQSDPDSVHDSNYINIDYFIQQNAETRSCSMESDGEYESAMPIMRTISHDDPNSQSVNNAALQKNLISAILVSGKQRGAKIRSILNTIIQSETIYVSCLNTMIQYKKAIHATLGTSKPVITEEEEDTIFFKLDELHEAHTIFLDDLKCLVTHDGGDVLIGETFKRLADMFDLYSAFLHNYNQAIETVKKCSANNQQFKQIVSTIVLNLQTEQSLTLEDLLHKPVARVQINALVFNDLLGCTPPNHPDHHHLKQAYDTIHSFLKQFNVVNQKLSTDSNKNLRRMVKNSFIVELVDGHRKLRHLFLFNDVIACAKYKASGRDRIDYDLKWFIPVKDVAVFEETDIGADLKESSPANILQLKTQACTVRDQLLMEEKDDKLRRLNGLKAGDKYRRKLADLESQLVLASPNLVLRIGNKSTNKTITFFLSSDFERSQWVDSILSLQQTCNMPSANTINALEVQTFIVAMQKNMKTEMGSYLMRNTTDESLLVGDLHITVHELIGLNQIADLYICLEVDSYGHYFRKATTKMVCQTMKPNWNESFVIELEGSQNVRVLLYELQERPIIRANYVLKLSRSWLQETPQNRLLALDDSLTLNITVRFVPGEVTLRRVPTSKPGALFGAKMNQVLKREKRDIPFIISACIREVERRGMSEVGIYRVSGSASDLTKLKKSFETNAYEAEQLLKEVDMHSVTGILKSYLRELPEALFTDALYPKFFEAFSRFSNNNDTERINELLTVFDDLPQAHKASINHILDHLIRIHHQEADNKMSLHNLAMVFGPTLLRPGATQIKQKDLLASSTVDVMAQAGILYCFLQARIKKSKNR